MPIYEYFCQDCENKFEVKASLSEKERGLKVSCPNCSSNKAIQILGNFFAISKSKSPNFNNGCGSNPSSGCCG